MKKLFILFTILIILIGLSAYVAYKIYYPKIVAQVVVNKKYVNLLPKKYNQIFSNMSDTVNSKIDKVIASTVTEGTTLDQLEAAILEIKKEDVEIIYRKLKNTKITTVEQVFDTISNNLNLKSFDIENLRKPFLIHVDKEHIKKGMKYIDMHDLFNTIDEKNARQIALQIFRHKKVEIKEKLDEAK